MSVSANATVDEKKYARLLTRALPSVIKTESAGSARSTQRRWAISFAFRRLCLFRLLVAGR